MVETHLVGVSTQEEEVRNHAAEAHNVTKLGLEGQVAELEAAVEQQHQVLATPSPLCLQRHERGARFCPCSLLHACAPDITGQQICTQPGLHATG